MVTPGRGAVALAGGLRDDLGVVGPEEPGGGILDGAHVTWSRRAGWSGRAVRSARGRGGRYAQQAAAP